MTVVKLAAVLIGAALLAGCADGSDQILSAVPAAAENDTVVDETEAADPMNPGAIEDSLGTQI